VPDVRRIVFDVIEGRLFGMSFEDFDRAMAGFEFIPVVVSGEEVGAIMRRGTELHVAVMPKARGKWLGRALFRSLQEMIEQHGEVTTAVMDSHKSGHEFVRRLGFVQTGQSDGVTHYSKGASC